MIPAEKQWLRTAGVSVLGAAIAILLGWVAVRGTDWGQVRSALVDFPPVNLATGLLLVVASGYLRAVRWRILWRSERISSWRLFWIENAALGANNLSPVRALDEPIEFGILALRDRLPGASIIATMVVCRVQDLAITLAFVAVVVIALPSLLQLVPIIVAVVLYLVVWLLILFNLDRIIRRFPALDRIPGIKAFAGAVTTLQREKGVMALSLAATASYWSLLLPIGWILGQGAGVQVSLLQLTVAVVGALFLSTSLPGLPGALGTFEFGAVAILGIWGVSKEPALTFTLVLHTVLFLPPTIIAILALPREGVGSVAKLRELVGYWRTVRSGKP